ncbi:MAG: hypothetical protein JWP12_2879 [Bacteroidetes bacterium]|nr:hypothetical protein [Bacteroidota bacterium]
MSAIPIFNQVNSSVYALSTIGDAGLSGYWAGYFAGPASNLGPSASTTAVWQDPGGFYLFLDQTPADWTVFAAELTMLCANFDPQNTARCVWISQAGSPSLQWDISALYAGFSGSGSSIAWKQLRLWMKTVGAYSFSLNGLGALTYIADASGGGVGFSGGAFSGPAGGYSFGAVQLLFSGSALGAFSGLMNIPASGETNYSDLWSSLRIGLQYTAAASTFDTGQYLPIEEYDPVLAYSDSTQVLFMPVFMTQTASLDLGILFDPLNLLVSTRTAFGLFPPLGTPPSSLSSYLRTTRGYGILLQPLNASGTIPAAQFVFGYSPAFGSEPGVDYYHLSPEGAFTVTIQNPEERGEGETVVTNQLLLGLSGLEYADLAGTSYIVVFKGGMPAFIPNTDPLQGQAPDVSQALTNLATTSYLNVLAYTGESLNPVYYAQPREAPVFSGREQRSDGILDFNPMPAVTLTGSPQVMPPVFPVGIYAGLTSENSRLASGIENASLAPYRNFCIGTSYTQVQRSSDPGMPQVPQRRIRAEDDPLGVTPQGLIAELTPDYKDFDGLIIGNMPGTNYPRVDLTAVANKFKQTLQSNQLFFVASNVDVLMSGTSVRYELLPADYPYLLALNVPQTIIDNVAAAITASGTIQPFDTEGQFVTCIQSAAGIYLACFLSICGILKVEMDGWTFQLSPRTWRTNAENPTLMIGKFCNRSLLDLANDSSSWNWPEAASQPSSWTAAAITNPGSWTWPGTTDPTPVSVGQTQLILLNLLNAAGAVDATPALRIFYDTVVTNPNWNGFLFLNAPVDIGEFPDDLKFLTAGINLKEFYAHHVGFSQTPFTVQNGSPQLEQTAAFGLINYEDEADLYADETIAFGFKTMQLRARFANAALADFSAEVELMLNQLLGSSLSKNEAARGNNLIIDGSYQRVGGAPSYAFTLTGQNLFNGNDSAIMNIEVLSVQLVNGGNPGSINVLTTFVLMGNLRFARYDTFDLFSFGPGETETDSYLRYSGLSIDMSFSLAAPMVQTFVVRESNTAFDLTNSVYRPSSLLNNFPLSVSALIASPDLSAEGETPSGQTPENMGFTSISAPIDQTPMVPSWYGLLYTLDLGTFGALTGSVSFKIGILVAWSKGPSPSAFPIYIGLRLPGISAITGSFPLQGVLKLGFRSFQFETYATGDLVAPLGYLLRMRRFALSVLVWSFPPGNADIVLFGQPGNPKGSIGWYAAYDSDKKKKQGSTKQLPGAKKQITENTSDPVERRLKSGRRKPRIG